MGGDTVLLRRAAGVTAIVRDLLPCPHAPLPFHLFSDPGHPAIGL